MDNENLYEQMLEQDLCKKCHRRKIDRSESPDSVLCKDCRDEMIKLKIPPVIFICAALTVVLFVITLTPFLGIGSSGIGGFGSGSAGNVDQLAEEGYVVSALDQLVSMLEENPDNHRTAIKLTDIAMKYSYFDYAAYAINNYLVGVEVSDSNYYKLQRYISKLNIYYDTLDVVEEAWVSLEDQAEEAGELDEAQTLALLDECMKKISGYIGNSSYNQAYLYYSLAYLSQDTDQRLAYLEKCVEEDPCVFDAQSQIAVIYRGRGQLDKAREVIEAAHNVNRQDYSILRAYATIELVSGNTEAGCSYASMAWDTYPEGTYVADTYIIALAANGQEEDARNLLKQCEEEGYIFEDDLYQFLSGEITLEDYYYNG